VACWDASHRFLAGALDPVSQVYRDRGIAATKWSAVPLQAADGALTSFNDYGYEHPLLSGDSAVASPDLYVAPRRAWELTGTNGVGVILPTVGETVGNATAGLSLSIWFLVQNTFGATNQGHNVLLSMSNAAGTSLRVTFTSGMYVRPRVSVKVAHFIPDDNTDRSTSSSDYAVSDWSFDPNPPVRRRLQGPVRTRPNTGSGNWVVNDVGKTWQNVVLTFGGNNGALQSLYWNGLPQQQNPPTRRRRLLAPIGHPTLRGPLPFGPLTQFSVGFDGGRLRLVVRSLEGRAKQGQ
jgi:hypothetical protein